VKAEGGRRLVSIGAGPPPNAVYSSASTLKVLWRHLEAAVNHHLVHCAHTRSEAYRRRRLHKVFKALGVLLNRLLDPKYHLCGRMVRIDLTEGRSENLRDDVGPTDQPPMLLNSSRQGNLLADFCTSGTRQAQLGNITFDTEYFGTSSRAANVDHEDFVLCQLADFCLLAVFGLDAEKTPEQEEVDFEVGVDGRKLAAKTQYVTHKTIGTAQGRINASTNTNEPTRDGELELVVLGKQRHDSTEDWLAFDLALVILGDNAGSNLNLIAKLEDTSEDGASSDTSLEILDLGTGFVDVETADDDHVWRSCEISDRNRNLVDQVLKNSIDVVFDWSLLVTLTERQINEPTLSGDWDDGASVGNRTANEFENALIVLQCVLSLHQVDLVLKNDDVV
jgi:hypothetical protein